MGHRDADTTNNIVEIDRGYYLVDVVPRRPEDGSGPFPRPTHSDPPGPLDGAHVRDRDRDPATYPCADSCDDGDESDDSGCSHGVPFGSTCKCQSDFVRQAAGWESGRRPRRRRRRRTGSSLRESAWLTGASLTLLALTASLSSMFRPPDDRELVLTTLQYPGRTRRKLSSQDRRVLQQGITTVVRAENSTIDTGTQVHPVDVDVDVDVGNGGSTDHSEMDFSSYSCGDIFAQLGPPPRGDDVIPDGSSTGDAFCAYARTCNGGSGTYIPSAFCRLPSVTPKRFSLFLSPVLLLWLVLLFRLLSSTAEVYFSPSLEMFSTRMGLPPRFAGVTLLALGNGAPDVSATVNAIRSDPTRGYLLALGALTGAGMFVGTVVAGTIVVAMGGEGGIPCRGALVRDVAAYLVTVAVVATELGTGRVGRRAIGIFLGMYVAYVLVVLIADVYHRTVVMPRLRTEKMLLEAAEKEDEELRLEVVENPHNERGGDGSISAGGKLEETSGRPGRWKVKFETSTDARPSDSTTATNITSSTNGDRSSSPLLSHRPSLGPSRPDNLVNGRTYGTMDGRGIGEGEREDDEEEGSDGVGESLMVRVAGTIGNGVLDRFSNYERSSVSSLCSTPGGRERSRRLLFGPGGAVADRNYRPAHPNGAATNGIDGPDGIACNGCGHVDVDGDCDSIEDCGAHDKDDSSSRCNLTGALLDGMRELGVYWTEEVWDDIFRDDEGNRRGTIESFLLLCELPFTVARKLTVPVPCEGYYCRPLVALSLALSPVWIATYVRLEFDTDLFAMPASSGREDSGGDAPVGTNVSVPYIVPICAVSCLVGLSVLLRSGGEKMSLSAAGPVALYGFVVAALWIDFIGDQLVNLLEFLGVVCRIPSAFMGLTVLAWGNSMGDLATNVTMARHGLANMAMTACFAGPVFNMLVGLGGGFASIQDAPGNDGAGAPVILSPPIATGFAFIGCNCALMIICGLLVHKGTIPRRHGYVMYAVYASYLGTSVAMEFWHVDK